MRPKAIARKATCLFGGCVLPVGHRGGHWRQSRPEDYVGVELVSSSGHRYMGIELRRGDPQRFTGAPSAVPPSEEGTT